MQGVLPIIYNTSCTRMSVYTCRVETSVFIKIQHTDYTGWTDEHGLILLCSIRIYKPAFTLEYLRAINPVYPAKGGTKIRLLSVQPVSSSAAKGFGRRRLCACIYILTIDRNGWWYGL